MKGKTGENKFVGENVFFVVSRIPSAFGNIWVCERRFVWIYLTAKKEHPSQPDIQQSRQQDSNQDHSESSVLRRLHLIESVPPYRQSSAQLRETNTIYRPRHDNSRSKMDPPDNNNIKRVKVEEEEENMSSVGGFGGTPIRSSKAPAITLSQKAVMRMKDTYNKRNNNITPNNLFKEAPQRIDTVEPKAKDTVRLHSYVTDDDHNSHHQHYDSSRNNNRMLSRPIPISNNSNRVDTAQEKVPDSHAIIKALKRDLFRQEDNLVNEIGNKSFIPFPSDLPYKMISCSAFISHNGVIDCMGMFAEPPHIGYRKLMDLVSEYGRPADSTMFSSAIHIPNDGMRVFIESYFTTDMARRIGVFVEKKIARNKATATGAHTANHASTTKKICVGFVDTDTTTSYNINTLLLQGNHIVGTCRGPFKFLLDRHMSYSVAYHVQSECHLSFMYKSDDMAALRRTRDL